MILRSTVRDAAHPTTTDIDAEVNEIPSAGRLTLLGLQHLLTFYATAVVLPVIIATGIGLSSEDTIVFIGATVLVGGIATIVQSVGVWKIGIRKPLVLGGSAVVIGPTIAIGTTGGGGTTGLLAVFGAAIVAGLVLMALAPLYGKMLRIFPPVVTGSVIAMVGLSLLPITIRLMGGGDPGAQTFGSATNMAIAGATILTILLIYRFGKGLLKSMVILVGLLVGGFVGVLLGAVDFSSVAEASWFGVTLPFHFGWPTFNLSAILAMTVAVIVIGVECVSSYFAIGEVLGRPPTDKEVRGGILAEGLASVLGGVFNSVPPTTFNGNIGLVRASNVKSRWVVAVAGGLMIIASFFPKIGALAAVLPAPAVGAALLALFGIITALGIQILSRGDLTKDRNMIVVAISIGVGFIPAVPGFFDLLPEALRLVLDSGVVITAIVAVVLNLVFNGVGRPAQDADQVQDDEPNRME